MAALVPLPRGLPGYTKLCSDLGPADSEVDGVVDECIKCGLRLQLDSDRHQDHAVAVFFPLCYQYPSTR